MWQQLLSCALTLSIVWSMNFSDWIDPIYLKHLETSYYKVLDHNNDGIVILNELTLGILSQLQSNTKLTDASIHGITSYIPQQYTCIPSLDFVDFIDCITIAARYMLKENDIDVTKPILFEDMFNKYIGECTDISPIENEYCLDIVMKSPEICMKQSIYCQLSCYSCNKESYIFSDKYPIRGLNGKYIQRPEQLSTYQPQKLPEAQVSAVENCTAVKADNHTGQLLFISDIHIEPWYNVKGGRSTPATMNNMWECHDGSSNTAQVPCTCTGNGDPPYDLWQSGMQFLKLAANPTDMTKDILIFGGDTQAHSYNSNTPPETETIPPLMNKVTDEILSMFPWNNIFYAAGNNDGQHDIIFCSGSDPKINTAWSTPFISKKIVNNDLNRTYTYDSKTYDQISLFNHTGYYIKKIPAVFSNATHNQNFYAVILNTNLGVSNAFQTAIFKDDLEWVQSQTNGHLLVIGHHPNVVNNSQGGIIPKPYRSIVSGSFSGHVHYFGPTDSTGFAILPALEGRYVAVLTADLNKHGDVVLTWDNFNEYLGPANRLPQENCWGYKGPQDGDPDDKNDKDHTQK